MPQTQKSTYSVGVIIRHDNVIPMPVEDQYRILADVENTLRLEQRKLSRARREAIVRRCAPPEGDAA